MWRQLAVIALLGASLSWAENKKAIELISQNKYAEAIVELTASIKKNGQDSVDWFNLGVAYYKNKNYPSATNAFQKVVELKSGLKDAALYYKALSEFNRNQDEAALRSIGEISNSSGFYKSAVELKAAVKNQSDEMFLEALTAYEEEDYEACLESLQDSMLADHPTGIELMAKCKSKTNRNQQPKSTTTEESSKIHLSARLNGSSSNNAYLTSSAPTRRFSVEAAMAAEYLVSAENSDYGAGITLESSASGSGSRSSTRVIDGQENQVILYAPYTRYIDNHEAGLELYYASTTVDSVSAYDQQGVSLGYLYKWTDFSFSCSPEVARKEAGSTTYAYMAGTYSSMKLAMNYEKENTKASVYLSPSQVATGDESVTGGTIPYAHRAVEVGAALSQWFGQSIKASAVLSNSKKNYMNKYSSILREDQMRYFKIQGLYKTSVNTKIYIESANTTNVSNYDKTQLANKNYTENVVTLGIMFNN